MNKVIIDDVEYEEVDLAQGNELYARWRVGNWIVMEILSNGLIERRWFKKK